jgi:hypothetical protein
MQVFWISYQDLLRNYQHFDRTRLFGPEWSITQQWTSLNVPWSVNYLDTKFKVTLPNSGPVVIVLSQLDDRYFRGLEGQYEFHLQFRLHKDDEDEYIVRSNAAYYMKRSVSTELDLEAGVYWVLLKITAKRYPDDPTVESVIAKTCQFRREKLLSIGLSYDLAHAKGNFRELEAEKLERERQDRRERRKATAKKMYEARVREHKKRKLRSIKLDLKKREVDIKKNEAVHKRLHEEAEIQRKREAEEAAKKMEEMKLQENDSTQGLGINGNGNGSLSEISMLLKDTPKLTNSPKTLPADYQSPQTGMNGRSTPTSRSFSKPSPSYTGGLPRRDTLTRRDTLSVSTFSNTPLLSFTKPDIRVQRANVSDGGKLSLSDISDDDLSWDSEIDAPEDTDSEAEVPPTGGGLFSGFDGSTVGHGGQHDSDDSDADDEFSSDPWNAVCVVGLRCYAKSQEVEIEVVRGGGEEELIGEGEDAIFSPVRQAQASLDVDDASKDAVKRSRTPVNSPITPRGRGGIIGGLSHRVMTWT